MFRRRLLAAAVLALALASVIVSSSWASTPTGGVIRIFVVPGNGQGGGTIVVAGAIGDYGKTTKESTSGMGEMLLQKGTIQVNLAAVSKKLNSSKPILMNAATCSYVFGATAPVRLMNGTGLYKGITGTISLTEMFAGYGPFYKTGAHKGMCNMSNNSTPIAQWGSVTGVGTVKFA
jgi:hypothetical protein